MTSLLQAGRSAPAWFGHHLFGEREVPMRLNSLEVAGNLQFTRSGLYAWYILGGQQWDFRTLDARRQLWDQQTYRYGQLAVTSPLGRGLRLRVTTRPYPAYEFARSLDEQNPGHLRQVPGGESWDDYLNYAQARLATTSLDQRVVALGLFIAPPPSAKVRKFFEAGERTKEVNVLLEEIAKVDKIVSGPGFDARPASTVDMAFLMHRSLSMGVPAPVHAGVGGSRWEASDLVEFTERRVWLAEPYGSSVKVLSEARGKAVERFVAVLTMGVMPDRVWPEDGRDPWIVASNRLSAPVEWSLSGSLLSAKALAGTVAFEQNRAQNIADHFAEHGEKPHPGVWRAIKAAGENLDEVTEGDSRTNPRFVGTVRAAVYGATEDEAMRHARSLVDLYGEKLNMSMDHPKGQAAALREFVPGETRVSTGYQRRMSVKYLASAMPNVDAEMGTPTGQYLGYGVGTTRRAARCDTHYGPEVLNTSGLFPIVAEPGGGKSVLIGTLAYNAVRAGEPTIIFDPSGPLAKLCDLPELRPFSKVLDLTASRAGTLSPYQLVPEPTKEAYTEDGVLDAVEFDRAVRRAAAERQQLMFDVLRMWLPVSVLRLPGCDVMLRDALRAVSAMSKKRSTPDTRTNPRWVIEALEAIRDGRVEGESGSVETRSAARRRALRLASYGGGVAAVGPSGREAEQALARQLIAELTAAADFPLGELIMPPHRHAIEDDELDDKLLVVVTMPGLSPAPEGSEREYWGSEERYTQPLLHLAAFYASRFIYSRPRDQRKNVFLDENHMMAQWGSGRAFFVRLSRDSRKWNTAIGAASQHPADHLSIGRVDALMGHAFVGRLTKEATAKEACKLIQCPEVYSPVLQALSPKPRDGQPGETGEFVWLDPLGRIGKIRIDMDWHPALRAALQTTPGRRRPDLTLVPQPTPFIDPDLFDSVPVIPMSEAVAA